MGAQRDLKEYDVNAIGQQFCSLTGVELVLDISPLSAFSSPRLNLFRAPHKVK